MTGLEERAQAWIDGDPDPGTRRRLAAMLEGGDRQALSDHLDGFLSFGTAGLRAAVGPGPARMNRAVVIRVTHGLAAHLREESGPGGGVVVGFDARPDSRRFALDVAGVLAAADVPVWWWPEPIPTPLVAHTAQVRGAAAAVVITASHNPPADNGYKLYAEGGRPVTSATERAVRDGAVAAGPADRVPRLDAPLADPRVTVLGEDVVRGYLEACEAARPALEPVDRSLPIVYTALHGVGGTLALRALREAGFGRVTPVAAQQEPDGRFPTVARPNPEEAGTLAMALEEAERTGAALVLANDPDADRLAVAVPGRAGGWRRLSGDEVGLLLTDHLLRHAGVAEPLVVSTLVSSPGCGTTARHHGARWETTLTGFKWIVAAADALRVSEGVTPVLGWEEALGYRVGEAVSDKDGVAAAVVVAELAGALRARGRSLLDARDALARRDGLWVSRPSSLPVADPGRLPSADPPPARLSGWAVTGVRDLRGTDPARPAWLPPAPLVVYDLDGGRGRVAVRPSGTEPRLKVYVHLSGKVAGEVGALEERLRGEASEVGAALARHLGIADPDPGPGAGS